MGKKKKIELKTTKIKTGIADMGAIQLTLKMPKKALKKLNSSYDLNEPMEMDELASILIQQIDVIFEALSNDQDTGEETAQEEETPVVEETEAEESAEVEDSGDEAEEEDKTAA